MKTMLQKICPVMLVLMFMAAWSLGGHQVWAGTEETVSEAQTVKNGLIQENGAYYYYVNGVTLKNSWKKIGNSKYYFKANGKAATSACKIKGSWYVFSAKGKLLRPSEAKVMTVNGQKFYVSKSGKALSGIRVINGKFYRFSARGKYMKAKTTKLRKAAKYSADFKKLRKLIGKPMKTKYYSYSCYGPGRDGVLKYKNFKVYVYQKPDKTVLFMSAE